MKKIITCLITLLLIVVMAPLTVFSEGIEKPDTAEWLVNEGDNHIWYFVNNIQYNNQENDYVMTIGGVGSIPDYVDPESTGKKSPLLDYSDMTMVTIREGVTGIGDNTFNGCENLDTLVIKGSTVLTLGDDALKNTSNNLKIYVKNGNASTYQTTTGWDSFSSVIDEGYFVDADAIHYTLDVDNFMFIDPGTDTIRANVKKIEKYYEFDKESFSAKYFDGEEKTATSSVIVDTTSPVWRVAPTPAADVMISLDVHIIPVAKIKDTAYKTLKEACDAAKDGDVINVLNRPVVEETINVDKNITIQSEDPTKIITATFSSNAFNVTGKLTIKNFTINTKYNGINVYGNYSKLVLGQGATINAASAIVYEDTSDSYALNVTDNGEILIDGGAINGTILVDSTTNGKLTVRSGIFSEEVDDKYIYEDEYITCTKQDNTDTKTKMRMPYAVVHDDYVAYNGDYGYLKLEHAIDEVKNNETIVLLNNNNENIEISRTVIFNVDTNGYTFDKTNIKVSSNYTISSSQDNGIIKFTVEAVHDKAVAKIITEDKEEIYYLDLQEALSDADIFDNVALVKDVYLTEDLDMNYAILDLDNHKLLTTKDIHNSGVIILYNKNMDLIKYIAENNIEGCYAAGEKLYVPTMVDPQYIIPNETFMSLMIDNDPYSKELSFIPNDDVYLVVNKDIDMGKQVKVTYNLDLNCDILASNDKAIADTYVNATNLILSKDVKIGSNDKHDGQAILFVESMEDGDPIASIVSNNHKIVLKLTGKLIVSRNAKFDESIIRSGLNGYVVDRKYNHEDDTFVYTLKVDTSKSGYVVPNTGIR